MISSLLDVAGLRSLAHVLEFWSARCPDRVAYSFLSQTGSEDSLTVSDLDREARRIAAYLREHFPAGSRALLLFPPGLDFVSAFFGCIYAGIIAVPTCYPKPRRLPPRLALIARDAQANLVLTTRDVLDELDLNQDRDLSGLPSIAVEEADGAPGFRPRKINPKDVAFLQYTSGSTSEPRGVMVSHANILSNLEAIRRGFQIDFQVDVETPATGVFWLPAYHDMGLIGGILTPLYVGGRSYLMSPQSFLQRPLRWLEAIDRTRAVISGAPNFAFDLCVRKTSPEQRRALDLSCWKLAFCGAEPIRAETLDQFAAALGEAGFRREALYPCYGLAETTLLAAGGQGPAVPRTKRVLRRALWQNRVVPANGEPDTEVQTFVASGVPALGHEVLVVDPQRNAQLREGEVGEIWIDGPSKAMGYWNRREESDWTFAARLANGNARSYLRTGDLGFLSDGELYVTGRLKEVIIVRGRNLYPQDIELTVGESCEELCANAGAAFSIDVNGEEQLVIAHEVDRRYRDHDWSRIVARVRRAVAREHDVDPHRVVLLRQGSLPLTTSGKIQRQLCRDKFLDDDLKIIHSWKLPQERSDQALCSANPARLVSSRGSNWSADDVNWLNEHIEFWLLDWLEQRGGVPAAEIHREKPFAEYGLDSLTAVELSQQLGDWLELELAPVLAWNYPTPAKLAPYLAARVSGTGGELAEAAFQAPAPSTEQFEQLLAEIEALSEREAEENQLTPCRGNRFDE
jgi:acyl-CoA synthetase (AMP-forming)/AMP-acid ligase II/acyl carrier protein